MRLKKTFLAASYEYFNPPAVIQYISEAIHLRLVLSSSSSSFPCKPQLILGVVSGNFVLEALAHPRFSHLQKTYPNSSLHLCLSRFREEDEGGRKVWTSLLPARCGEKFSLWVRGRGRVCRSFFEEGGREERQAFSFLAAARENTWFLVKQTQSKSSSHLLTSPEGVGELLLYF